LHRYRPSRRVILPLAILFVVLSASVLNAFPDRTITIVIPYTPGGSTDLMARLLGQRLSEVWGQPVVISNQPGAGGSIGAAHAAKAAPDGYTWLMTTNSPMTTNLSLYKSLDYDTLHDFEPVVMVANSPMLLLSNPTSGLNSVKELLAAAKANTDKYRAGISGNGATTHLAIAELSARAGVHFGIVPYRGGVPMLTALIPGEEIQLGFSDIVPALPLVREGKLRALATPQLQRSVVAPEIPTLDESGLPRFDVTPWTGIFVPMGTAAADVSKINAQVNDIFNEPAFRERVIAIGQDPVAKNTAEEFTAFVRSEIPRWQAMVRSAGVEIQGMPAQ
jgi:tripartite-type tricarboxylate transporter receptor subunit TctC